ncbi:LysR family transcriptional regulator [Azohydromonas caseinilytica]|uniref:LysR family transcriptional regulator n=1 Tax=Azohydromonas caseinilytica TaxID=2728836 RepID=A0A848FEP6_9BURK|nr:LysR family transcriptional regulator [Azohydromonas caseinilytica]NML16371.1 LysR family transcriptional regulator [Azohydromonas caseinilytica]
MHGLQQYVAFAETARHGSFAAAARALGTVPSTLAKAVARLETELGVRLFHRTTRQVTLTPDGERLYAHCQRLLAEVEELQAQAAGTRSEPSGTLRVDLPIFYGKHVVMPVLARLVQRHPALRLDVRLHDAYVDLVQEGIDLAVRVGRLDDSSLVARRIDQQRLVLCASPAYLAARGAPSDAAALAAHAAIAFRMPSSGRHRPWQFLDNGQAVEMPPPNVVARINDGEGMVEAARLGLGLCQVPDYMAAAALARGDLVELLPGCRPEPLPISVVVPGGKLLPARVRVAVDALSAARAEPPAQTG